MTLGQFSWARGQGCFYGCIQCRHILCPWTCITIINASTSGPGCSKRDNFIPGINHAILRIKFIPGLNCVAQSGDKFILGINRANPGIKLTQRLIRVKSLSLFRYFVVMKQNRKQVCRSYICFSNNISASIP